MESQLGRIETQLTNLVQSMADIREILDYQSKKLESCLGKIDILQGVTNDLHSRVSELKNKNQSSPQDMYNEVRMRIEREKNVIIVGLDESLDTTKVVEEVLITISAHETISIMKTSRLGFPKEGRARPVKVELPDTDSVQMIVGNRKKIASQFSNLVVKCDRTPEQYEELATLYNTLAARKAAGENVAIKYKDKKTLKNICPEETLCSPHFPNDDEILTFSK
ncbi:hypothetical protein JTB14_018501 [Gonioctena quinquepunctata]|nr:hypothetical protein JTB14_018501 [Gonioctena quinquepunctata]